MIEFGHTTDRKPPFRYAAYERVQFSDTDAQGVVYYGRYNPYFDLARGEWLRSLGLLHRGNGDTEFVMRANDVEYFAPARFDDEIEVDVRISRIGTSSVTYEFAAYLRGEVPAAKASQTVVLVDLVKHEPCRVPDSWREKIREIEGDDLEA